MINHPEVPVFEYPNILIIKCSEIFLKDIDNDESDDNSTYENFK